MKGNKEVQSSRFEFSVTYFLELMMLSFKKKSRKREKDVLFLYYLTAA